MTLLKQAKDSYTIAIRPKLEIDKDGFSTAMVQLDSRFLLPIRVTLIAPNGKDTKDFILSGIEPNKAVNEANFKGQVLPPPWKVVRNDPDGPGPGPAPAARPAPAAAPARVPSPARRRPGPASAGDDRAHPRLRPPFAPSGCRRATGLPPPLSPGRPGGRTDRAATALRCLTGIFPRLIIDAGGEAPGHPRPPSAPRRREGPRPIAPPWPGGPAQARPR